MISSLSSEQRKELVRQYVETSWNGPATESCDDVLRISEANIAGEDALDATIPRPPCVYLGTERLNLPLPQLRQAMQEIFPDVRVTVVELIAEGEKVVVRWLMQGTDLGGFEGAPPTGRPMCVSGMTLMKLEHLTIVEEWNEVDIAGMLRQLGFVYTQAPPRITMRRPRPSHLP